MNPRRLRYKICLSSALVLLIAILPQPRLYADPPDLSKTLMQIVKDDADRRGKRAPFPQIIFAEQGKSEWGGTWTIPGKIMPFVLNLRPVPHMGLDHRHGLFAIRDSKDRIRMATTSIKIINNTVEISIHWADKIRTKPVSLIGKYDPRTWSATGSLAPLKLQGTWTLTRRS